MLCWIEYFERVPWCSLQWLSSSATVAVCHGNSESLSRPLATLLSRFVLIRTKTKHDRKKRLCIHSHVLYLDLQPVIIKLRDLWFNKGWSVRWLLLVPLYVSIANRSFTINWEGWGIWQWTTVWILLNEHIPSMARCLWIILSKTGVWQTCGCELEWIVAHTCPCTCVCTWAITEH